MPEKLRSRNRNHHPRQSSRVKPFLRCSTFRNDFDSSFSKINFERLDLLCQSRENVLHASVTNFWSVWLVTTASVEFPSVEQREKRLIDRGKERGNGNRYRCRRVLSQSAGNTVKKGDSGCCGKRTDQVP